MNLLTSINMINDLIINIFTDGSTKPSNPGPSGYGFYGTDSSNNTYSGYGVVGVYNTNNQAELQAVHKSLEFIYESHKNNLTVIKEINLSSDSQYVVNNVKRIDKWVKNNWTSETGAPISNADYWSKIKDILKLFKNNKTEINFIWIRGHSGILGNEIADKNADKGRTLLGTSEAEHYAIIHEAFHKTSNSSLIIRTM